MNIFGRMLAGISQKRLSGISFTRALQAGLFPLLKIDCPGEQREHNKLRKGHACALRQIQSSFKGGLPVRRQPKNKRAENMDVVVLELLQPADNSSPEKLKSL